MAYSGFLIRTGDYEIPLEYISCQTYKVTRSIQDLNSYRDSNGELHREALEHTLEKVEFETVPKLYGNEMGKLIKGISDNYIIAGERKVLATVFIRKSMITLQEKCMCRIYSLPSMTQHRPIFGMVQAKLHL